MHTTDRTANDASGSGLRETGGYLTKESMTDGSPLRQASRAVREVNENKYEITAHYFQNVGLKTEQSGSSISQVRRIGQKSRKIYDI